MLSTLINLLVIVAFIFWLIQVVDLLMRDLRDFESHTHKLTWFLVLLVGFVVGALWYYAWKRHLIAAKAETLGR